MDNTVSIYKALEQPNICLVFCHSSIPEYRTKEVIDILFKIIKTENILLLDTINQNSLQNATTPSLRQLRTTCCSDINIPTSISPFLESPTIISNLSGALLYYVCYCYFLFKLNYL